MKKIVVANRGEIAIRVMKTARKMGIKTVAVYSTIDRNAPHVKYADEAVCIGEAPSNQSYLLGSKIIEVAKSLGADAIHPGYGFLSENADFAEEAERNNIIFIGPKSKAIRIMGSKLAAKDAVKDYNIPMVPGYDQAITDVEKAKEGISTVQDAAVQNKNMFEQLMETCKYASLGQITSALFEVGGQYRRNM